MERERVYIYRLEVTQYFCWTRTTKIFFKHWQNETSERIVLHLVYTFVKKMKIWKFQQIVKTFLHP